MIFKHVIYELEIETWLQHVYNQGSEGVLQGGGRLVSTSKVHWCLFSAWKARREDEHISDSGWPFLQCNWLLWVMHLSWVQYAKAPLGHGHSFCTTVCSCSTLHSMYSPSSLRDALALSISTSECDGEQLVTLAEGKCAGTSGSDPCWDKL